MADRVLFVRKMKGFGYYVDDDRGVHLRFKNRATGNIINYFGTKRLALKAIRDAFPGALVSKR